MAEIAKIAEIAEMAAKNHRWTGEAWKSQSELVSGLGWPQAFWHNRWR